MDQTDLDPRGWGTATALVVSQAGDGRTYRSQCRALMLKAVTHNILIVLCALRALETTLAAA